MPTHLQIIDSCTTETTSEVLLNNQRTVAELERFSRAFDKKVMLCASDRFAANEPAEKAVQTHDSDKGIRWNRGHFCCDIHKAATVQSKTSELVSADISGILSLAISLNEAVMLRWW